jgi:hypothetical protein
MRTLLLNQYDIVQRVTMEPAHGPQILTKIVAVEHVFDTLLNTVSYLFDSVPLALFFCQKTISFLTAL